MLPSDKWCALCPSLALYQCCTPQETDKWGEPVDPLSDESEGCGLVLCEDCAVALGEVDGNLETVISLIENCDQSEEIWTMGTRADAEFLKPDGLLIRNVMGIEGDAMDIDD